MLVGWLAQRTWDRRIIGTLVSFLAGSAVIYAVGLPWLGLSLAQLGLPHSVNATLQAGLYPFIIGDTVKALIAAALLPAAWQLTSRKTP